MEVQPPIQKVWGCGGARGTTILSLPLPSLQKF